MRRIRIGMALLMMTGLLVIVQSHADLIADDFLLVTGVLNQFGRWSESDSFKVQISSGGQPTPPGVSRSDSFQVRHGYVHTSKVLHGDANADGSIDMGDMVYIINYLYQMGPPPIPLEAGDVDCDGDIDVGDVVYIQNYLFRGGPPPCDPVS